ncbi:MAG: hypothetical protein MUF54_09295 [Polyangiaceae bacterium]|jgi:ribonuclease HI|nr:hypothetical protein [Polyangiaceae bacterium]
MFVTCYTDASYSPAAGGSWAVWLRSDQGRLVRSGPCPDWIGDSVAAELAAIFAGIYLAVRTWGPTVKTVLVRSDCQAALGLADCTAQLSRRPPLRRLQERTRAAVARGGICLMLRWVPGHQSARSSTWSWLNVRCDRLAKEARKRVSETRELTRKQKRRLRRQRARARRRTRAQAAAQSAPACGEQPLQAEQALSFAAQPRAAPKRPQTKKADHR